VYASHQSILLTLNLHWSPATDCRQCIFLTTIDYKHDLLSGIMHALQPCSQSSSSSDSGTVVDLLADGVNGLPLKATGTVLDHRLCSQQSVYDARSSSKIKVRIHYIRDWVVDYSPPVTVWLITDWAWYR